MAGTPLKTAKKLTKLKMLLDCALNAVIDETPERYTDMYELAEPLPNGDQAAEFYIELRHAVSNAHWHVEQLLTYAKAELINRQHQSLAEIENSGNYQMGRYELTWTEEVKAPVASSTAMSEENCA